MKSTTQAENEIPPGLDEQRHSQAQREAHVADVLVSRFTPSCIATALNHPEMFTIESARIYLDRILADAGDPKDPIKRMLIEQMAFANLRLSKLNIEASEAKSLEAIKILNGVCARMLGEMRRTSQTIDELKDRKPAAPKLKIAAVG